MKKMFLFFLFVFFALFLIQPISAFAGKGGCATKGAQGKDAVVAEENTLQDDIAAEEAEETQA
jgi:hypothetical protein